MQIPRPGKGCHRFLLPEDYVLVDLETTGLNPILDSIIEIGAVRVRGGVECARFQTLVCPPPRATGRYVEPFITALTGITNDMLRGQPSIFEALPAFRTFAGNDLILGYNVGFDVNFLYENYFAVFFEPFRNDYVDVLRFARRLYPEMPHHRLCDMVTRFHVTTEGEHRAIADCLATKLCYEEIRRDIRSRCGEEEHALEMMTKARRGSARPRRQGTDS